MTKSTNQKLKLLYLMKILLEKTDEDNTIALKEILLELDRYGITAERKSIYDDLEALRVFGIDIATRKSKTTEYFIANRTFELVELKLLVDAVQCSKFITHKKSNELIKKIESYASVHQAAQLHRQVFVFDRVKTINENIYYSVDRIHVAISENRKIAFKYFDLSLDKQKVYRKNGEKYLINPYALSWDSENYYLVTYSEKYQKFVNYRVDRITDIEVIDSAKDKLPDNEKFNVAEYTKKLFGMYGGEEETVKLQFDNSCINAVTDRFGKDITLEKVDDNSFCIRVMVAISDPFFAWIFKFGNKVKIISPVEVVKRYKENLQDVMEQY